MKSLILAACLLVAAPALAEAKGKPAAEEKAAPEATKDAFNIAQVMAMFDKMFPAGPEPAPARLALARTTAQAMFPNGTYAALFDEAMSGIVDRVLAINPGDLMPAKGDAKVAPLSLHDQLAKDDPYFDERMKIMRRVIGEELIKISALMEPKLREGLARSIARRFDEKQLQDVNAFLATDSGRAFAGQSMRMWVDPDVMRSMMQSMPHIVAAMPGAMIRLETETAHLPKPKKKAAEIKAEPKT